MTQLDPYLSFNGNAEEAFNFYRSVFGGDFETVMRWKDNPQCEGMSEADKNKVMHVALKIGRSVLMGSDFVAGGPDGDSFKGGNNFAVSIMPDSREEADRLYAGLSEGGKSFMPMSEMFWGGYFGTFVDKFGIRWMINHMPNQG